MSDPTTIDVLNKIKEIGTMAGLRSMVDEPHGHVVTGFGFPDGRSQNVFIRHIGTVGNDHNVVRFFSPAMQVKKGVLSGLSKQRAVELLARNENTLFARFGIWQGGGSDMIVASADHLLETLDPEEFRASAGHVAVAADKYEQENGRDVF